MEVPDDQRGGQIDSQGGGEGPAFAPPPDGHGCARHAGNGDGRGRPQVLVGNRASGQKAAFNPSSTASMPATRTQTAAACGPALAAGPLGVGQRPQRRHPPGGRHDEQRVDGPAEHQACDSPRRIRRAKPEHANGSSQRTVQANRPSAVMPISPTRWPSGRRPRWPVGKRTPPPSRPRRSSPAACRRRSPSPAARAATRPARRWPRRPAAALPAMPMPSCTFISVVADEPAAPDVFPPHVDPSPRRQPGKRPGGGRDRRQLQERDQFLDAERPRGQHHAQGIAQRDGQLRRPARRKRRNRPTTPAGRGRPCRQDQHQRHKVGNVRAEPVEEGAGGRPARLGAGRNGIRRPRRSSTSTGSRGGRQRDAVSSQPAVAVEIDTMLTPAGRAAAAASAPRWPPRRPGSRRPVPSAMPTPRPDRRRTGRPRGTARVAASQQRADQFRPAPAVPERHDQHGRQYGPAAAMPRGRTPPAAIG